MGKRQKSTPLEKEQSTSKNAQTNDDEVRRDLSTGPNSSSSSVPLVIADVTLSNDSFATPILVAEVGALESQDEQANTQEISVDSESSSSSASLAAAPVDEVIQESSASISPDIDSPASSCKGAVLESSAIISSSIGCHTSGTSTQTTLDKSANVPSSNEPVQTLMLDTEDGALKRRTDSKKIIITIKHELNNEELDTERNSRSSEEKADNERYSVTHGFISDHQEPDDQYVRTAKNVGPAEDFNKQLEPQIIDIKDSKSIINLDLPLNNLTTESKPNKNSKKDASPLISDDSPSSHDPVQVTEGKDHCESKAGDDRNSDKEKAEYASRSMNKTSGSSFSEDEDDEMDEDVYRGRLRRRGGDSSSVEDDEDYTETEEEKEENEDELKGNASTSENESENECEDSVKACAETELLAVKEKEDKTDPATVPKNGRYYMHEDRDNEAGEAEVVRAIGTRRPGMLVDHWAHDKYNEQKQAPRTLREKNARLTSDIRYESKKTVASVEKKEQCAEGQLPSGQPSHQKNDQHTGTNKNAHLSVSSHSSSLNKSERQDNAEKQHSAAYSRGRGGHRSSRHANQYAGRRGGNFNQNVNQHDHDGEESRNVDYSSNRQMGNQRQQPQYGPNVRNRREDEHQRCGGGSWGSGVTKHRPNMRQHHAETGDLRRGMNRQPANQSGYQQNWAKKGDAHDERGPGAKGGCPREVRQPPPFDSNTKHQLANDDIREQLSSRPQQQQQCYRNRDVHVRNNVNQVKHFLLMHPIKCANLILYRIIWAFHLW